MTVMTVRLRRAKEAGFIMGNHSDWLEGPLQALRDDEKDAPKKMWRGAASASGFQEV